MGTMERLNQQLDSFLISANPPPHRAIPVSRRRAKHQAAASERLSHKLVSFFRFPPSRPQPQANPARRKLALFLISARSQPLQEPLRASSPKS